MYKPTQTPILFKLLKEMNDSEFKFFNSLPHNYKTDYLSLLNERIEDTLIDKMTGAYSRLSRTKDLEDLVSYSKRTGETFSIILLDIDHFKKINDTYGHDVGDKVIINLVDLLNKRTRLEDRVYRQGGEEFTVIFDDTHLKQCFLVAEELRKNVEKSLIIEKDKIATISLGIAEYNKNEDIQSLLKRADEALYQAKNTGRNKVCYSLK